MRCEEKWVRSPESEEQGDEEESLSLCDFPVNLPAQEEEEQEERPLLSPAEGEEARLDPGPNSEDFDFVQLLGGSIGSKSSSSEMCAADDIFFQGQILPFRHSLSSEGGGISPFKPTGQRQDSLSTTSRSISRSESMDRSSSNGGFTRFSSRSSSTNSHYSSSSSASSNSNSARPRIINRFHAFPSPKPQILKTPNAQPLGSAAGVANRSKRSSIWETLRLGLVRAPEMEFQDLKSRSSVSRNSSTGSSKTEKQGTGGKNPPPVPPTKTKRSYSTGRLLGGCDCTVGAVRPVALNHENVVVVKSNKKKHRDDRRRGKQGSGEEENKSKTTNSGMMKSMATVEKEKEKRPQRQRGKQEASRHRTVEWIKKLSSHGGFVVVGDHEGR